ncbi:MAG: hypothetical protein Q7O12_10365 [Deltaproteobacteria bacterium]|nr:hypothetical protein [Deltaproteobacteria bacterium]
MKKTVLVFLAACLMGAVGCGGGSARTEATPEKSIAPEAATAEKSVAVETTDEGKPLPIEGTRAAKYRRLAFVCAPGTGADPKYVPMVLREIETTVPKYLSEQNLQKVSIIPDASIDISTVPPTARFKTINDYDAVAIITYTYSPMVLMDINLIDVKTGQKLWFLQLHAKPDNIDLRLNKLAHIVPHRINKYFYRRR